MLRNVSSAPPTRLAFALSGKRLADLPTRAGESHMRLWHLWSDYRWILKVSPDSQGDADGLLPRMFWRLVGSSGGQFAPRAYRSAVYRVFGFAVRCEWLHGHGRVWDRQGDAFAGDSDARTRHSEPRYLQCRVPPARSKSFRSGIPEVHGRLFRGGQARQDQGCGGGGRQSPQARLRSRSKPYAKADGHAVGRA